MRKLFGSSGKKKHSKVERPKKERSKSSRSKMERSLYKRYIPYICLVTVGAFFIAVGARELLNWERDDVAARVEYQQLRDVFESSSVQQTPEPLTEEIEESEIIEEEEEEGFPTLEELARMNSDFIGWISVKDLIEYPIVRGRDNEKYINTTFTGQQNTAGAIFMDYRHSRGFDEKVCIIYGHHTRDGTMFAPLLHYLNPSFLQRNPNITITTPDGRFLTYRIFAARLTDAWDVAYSVGISDTSRAAEVFPNAPANASRFLVLSTCTRSNNDDERIIVFAASVD